MAKKKVKPRQLYLARDEDKAAGWYGVFATEPIQSYGWWRSKSGTRPLVEIDARSFHRLFSIRLCPGQCIPVEVAPDAIRRKDGG